MTSSVGIGWGRSIPACAGEPLAPPDVANPGEVYPRVCGGTRRERPRLPAGKGLSPRVRGNPGEPIPKMVAAVTGTVYPRVCGGTP